jgi:hypothetical protein
VDKKTAGKSIVLTFSANRRIEHSRIKEAIEPYPDRWIHHVVIDEESDFDDSVREWLRESYKISQNRKARTAA